MSSRRSLRSAPHLLWPPGRTDGVLLLDTGITAPNAAFSAYRKLRRAYSGPAIRVRRSSGGEDDFYFTSGDILNVSELLAFCAGGSGFIRTWYDQSGNGRDVTQTTTTAQPRIVNAGVLDQLATGPAIRFDGTDDRLFRADALGFSGSAEMTVAWVAKTTSSNPPVSASWHIGGTTFGTNNMLNASNAGSVAGLGKGGSAYRNFTLPITPDNPIRYIGYRPASNRADAHTLEANGVALPQAVLADGTDTAGLTNTQTNVGMNFGAFNPWPGSMNFLAFFAGAISGANLAALRAEQQVMAA